MSTHCLRKKNIESVTFTLNAEWTTEGTATQFLVQCTIVQWMLPFILKVPTIDSIFGDDYLAEPLMIKR